MPPVMLMGVRLTEWIQQLSISRVISFQNKTSQSRPRDPKQHVGKSKIDTSAQSRFHYKDHPSQPIRHKGISGYIKNQEEKKDEPTLRHAPSGQIVRGTDFPLVMR